MMPLVAWLSLSAQLALAEPARAAHPDALPELEHAEPVAPEPEPTAPEPVAPAPTAPEAAPPEPTVPQPTPVPEAPTEVLPFPVLSAETWLDTLLPAPVPPPGPTDDEPALPLLPSPSDLVAHGPETAKRRLMWLIASVLTVHLTTRIGRRRSSGPIRRQLDRIAALARTSAVVSLLGTVLALLPAHWLPWVLLVSASAAVAVGWSLRPLVNDGLAGIYLGLAGRHSPGTSVRLPHSRGVIHRPGPLLSVVRTESGALETVPNRQLAIDIEVARRTGRTPLEVPVHLPDDLDATTALDAIHWVCAVLPWTADDAPRVRPPVPGRPGVWSVELVLVGDAPPVDRVLTAFPTLVCDVLQCGKEARASADVVC